MATTLTAITGVTNVPTPVEFIDLVAAKNAPCLSVDPEVMHPVGDGKVAQRQIAAAKAVCAGCPIIATCLAYALHEREDGGVWGGRSEEERREYRRALRGEETKAQKATREALAVNGTLFAVSA